MVFRLRGLESQIAAHQIRYCELARGTYVVAVLHLMKKKAHPLEEPGQQWFWKITLTILCAVVGAIVTVYFFRGL
jgi:hypothetical protein